MKKSIKLPKKRSTTSTMTTKTKEKNTSHLKAFTPSKKRGKDQFQPYTPSHTLHSSSRFLKPAFQLLVPMHFLSLAPLQRMAFPLLHGKKQLSRPCQVQPHSSSFSKTIDPPWFPSLVLLFSSAVTPCS